MNEVEDIKARLDIVDFVSHYVTLKKAGANYKGLCPFHDERTPSFMVSPEKQIFKCFGCNEGGDVIEFVMKQNNWEFPEALEMLADKAGVQLKKFQAPSIKSQISSKSQLFQINMAAAQLWHKILIDHPAGKTALEYLRRRNIVDKTIKQWLVGYAPTQETTRAFLVKKGYTLEQIKAAGSPDRFFNRIMFPLFDVIGNVVAFTGRATKEGQEPKYLNTSETSLYYKSRFIYGLHASKNEIKKQDRVIVVEGQMDVVASHQAGVANVVATSGTALTKDHLVILARYTPNVVLAFDADSAGLKATKSALDLALDLELTVRVIEMPKGFKDVGELVEKGPDKWQKLASVPVPWLEFLMHQFPAAFSLEDKKKVAKEILPFLARVRDPIEQAHWVKKLASLLSVKEDAVAQALNRITNKESRISSKEMIQIAKQTLSLEEELYGLLLIYPALKKEREDLFNRLKKWYNKPIDQLELMIKERYQGFDDTKAGEVLNSIIERLKQRKAAHIKDDFAEKIAKAEAAGDREMIKKLFQQLQESLKK